MAFQAHSFVTDDAYKLSDSVTCTGSAVPGTVAFIDLGQVSPAYSVNTSTNNPYCRFAVVIDYGAIDLADGNEDYYVEVQGSNTSAFSSGNRLVNVRMGIAASIGKPTNTPPNGRIVLYGDNAVVNSATDANSMITTRYIRLRVEAFGTSPSITITKAYLVPL